MCRGLCWQNFSPAKCSATTNLPQLFKSTRARLSRAWLQRTKLSVYLNGRNPPPIVAISKTLPSFLSLKRLPGRNYLELLADSGYSTKVIICKQRQLSQAVPFINMSLNLLSEPSVSQAVTSPSENKPIDVFDTRFHIFCHQSTNLRLHQFCNG